jgi:pyocin large subunit-like protein
MSSTNNDCIASIRVKLKACAELYAQRNPSGTLAAALRTEAEQASTSTNLSLLRRISAETDVMLRETLDADALVIFAARLSEQGVANAHIPKPPTVRVLRTILKNGNIKNEKQLSIVRGALDSNTYGQLEREELVRLGALFDAYTQK